MQIATLNSGHMDFGGIERVVAYQARGLHGRGYEVAIFTPVNNPQVFREVIPSTVSLKPWWHTLPTPMILGGNFAVLAIFTSVDEISRCYASLNECND